MHEHEKRFRFSDRLMPIKRHDPDPKGRVSAKWNPVFGQDHAHQNARRQRLVKVNER
jgi:hypothetical protein